MPAFILVGFQRSLKNQIEKALFENAIVLGGWEPHLMQGDDHKQPSLSKKLAEKVLEKAGQLDGPHVFGVATRGPNFANMVRENFRYRQISAASIGKTGAGDFDPLINEMAMALRQEDYWIENIKPKDCSSPLILPKIFNAKSVVKGMWDQAESYGNNANLIKATELIDRFATIHRQKVQKPGFEKNPWVCDKEWIWKDDGQRHGEAVFPDDWKYSFKLEDGFHYDVSSKNDLKNRFLDCDCNWHSLVKGYLNVTAQGRIRGAKKTLNS